MSLTVPAGAFAPFTHVSITSLDPIVGIQPPSEGVLSRDVMILIEINNTALKSLTITLSSSDREEKRRGFGVDLRRQVAKSSNSTQIYWLDQISNTWQVECSSKCVGDGGNSSCNITATLNATLLNNDALKATAGQCHPDLLSVCGKDSQILGGIFAAFEKEYDACLVDASTNSTDWIMPAATAGAVLALVAAFAALYYCLFKGRNKPQQDKADQQQVGDHEECYHAIGSSSPATAGPIVIAEVGHFLNPVQPASHMSKKEQTRMRQSRALYWWQWRGSLRVLAAWILYAQQERKRKQRTEEFESFLGRASLSATPRLGDGNKVGAEQRGGGSGSSEGSDSLVESRSTSSSSDDTSTGRSMPDSRDDR